MPMDQERPAQQAPKRQAETSITELNAEMEAMSSLVKPVDDIEALDVEICEALHIPHTLDLGVFAEPIQ